MTRCCFSRTSRRAAFADVLRFDGILFNLQIIGEAVKKLPQELRLRYPDVPWREIAGLRDFVAHAYFALDLNILWDAIQRDVPALLTRVREILTTGVSRIAKLSLAEWSAYPAAFYGRGAAGMAAEARER